MKKWKEDFIQDCGSKGERLNLILLKQKVEDL